MSDAGHEKVIDLRDDGRVSVVIADDNIDMLLVLRVSLELRGSCRVVQEVTSADDAIAAVHDLQPDVLVLDIRLPDMSGTRVIPVVRAISPTTRIVMVSACDRFRPDPANPAVPDAYVAKANIRDVAGVIERVHRRPTPLAGR